MWNPQLHTIWGEPFYFIQINLVNGFVLAFHGTSPVNFARLILCLVNTNHLHRAEILRTSSDP